MRSMSPRSLEMPFGRILPAADAVGDILAPRFLVSVFVPDRTGIAYSILSVFDHGVAVGDSETVHFSVDGSLLSVAEDICSLTFVVRVVDLVSPDGLPTVESELREELRKALARLYASNLESFFEGGRHEPTITPFTAQHESWLYRNRPFTEFRFGVADRSFPHQIERLAIILNEFTAGLRTLRVPIAYLYFPMQWSTAAQDLGLEASSWPSVPVRWLRIAIGGPPEVGNLFELQREADRLAEASGASLALYSPASTGTSMGKRFTLVRQAIDRSASEHGDEVANRVEGDHSVLFVGGPARVGLVDDVLKIVLPLVSKKATLSAGTMTVLQGHTVASWTMPSSSAGSAADALRGAKERLRLTHVSGPHDVGERGHVVEKRGSFWIAWRCGDRPGMFKRVLETVAVFSGVDPLDGPDVANRLSIDYALSRVLADGRTCAGKVKFSEVHSGDRGPIDEAALAEALRSALRDAIEGWACSKPDWMRNPVLVARSEPAEDPWAELVTAPRRKDVVGEYHSSTTLSGGWWGPSRTPL